MDAQGVREHLIERFRVADGRYPPVMPADPPLGGLFVSPYQRRIKLLEAGEPLTVYGWEVPAEARTLAGVASSHRVLVDAEGTLRRECR